MLVVVGGRKGLLLRQWRRRQKGVGKVVSVAGARERETQGERGGWAIGAHTTRQSFWQTMHVSKPPTKAKERPLTKKTKRGEKGRGIAGHTQSKTHVKQKARCLSSAIITLHVFFVCVRRRRSCFCVLFVYIHTATTKCLCAVLARSLPPSSFGRQMGRCTTAASPPHPPFFYIPPQSFKIG